MEKNSNTGFVLALLLCFVLFFVAVAVMFRDYGSEVVPVSTTTTTLYYPTAPDITHPTYQTKPYYGSDESDFYDMDAYDDADDFADNYEGEFEDYESAYEYYQEYYE